LRRIGKRKQPQYRLVVADSASPRDGRFIETIGRYDPRVDPALVSVDEARALWWLQHGAQPSDTAKSMLARVGVWEKFTGEPRPEGAPASAPVAKAEPDVAVQAAEPSEAAPSAAPEPSGGESEEQDDSPESSS